MTRDDLEKLLAVLTRDILDAADRGDPVSVNRDNAMAPDWGNHEPSRCVGCTITIKVGRPVRTDQRDYENGKVPLEHQLREAQVALENLGHKYLVPTYEGKSLEKAVAS